MIEKVTPEVRNKFIESIKRTQKKGKEHIFLMCKNENEKLFPTEIKEGNERMAFIKIDECPEDIQGTFHTHPDLSFTKKFIKNRYNMEITDKRGVQIIERVYKNGITSESPSFPDMALALIQNMTGITDGTLCVGSDVHPNRVECWTPKKRIIEEDIGRLKEMKGIPKDIPEWMIKLFDREIMELK